MSGFKIDEFYIYQIPIAILSNSENEYNTTNEKKHTLDLEDTLISFDKFTELFYKNMYSFFELNDQYKGDQSFSINKNIKNLTPSFFKKTSILSIVDIMSENYIAKNKTKLPHNKYMNLIKEVNYYSSLLDYKNYKQSLSLEDIYSIFSLQTNIKNKTHFRFVVTANYYSSDLQENIDLNLGYLVEIPNTIMSNTAEPVIENIINTEFANEVINTDTVENLSYSNYNDEKDFLSSFNF
jgi:hypothetical protein